MGQKVMPTGFRVGIYGEHKGWISRWYAPKAEYARLLREDQLIRKHLKTKHGRQGAISSIEIERVPTSSGSPGEARKYRVNVYVNTGRPGVLIGRKGANLQILEKALQKLTGQQINLQVKEIAKPELEAVLLAESAAEQLAKRASFRRTMRNVLRQAKEMGALGCRIRLAGRLGGAEMARTEVQSFGSIPLQTLTADVNYGTAIARTTYGVIGVKVWVYRGTLKGAPANLTKRSAASSAMLPQGGED